MTFRPALLPTLALAALAALFVMLGNWQLARMGEKQDRVDAFASAVSVREPADIGDLPRYTRVELSGRYDAERHLLLDNQVENGRPGVHVLTPFYRDRGGAVLVNRGWLPLGPNRGLPAVPTPAGPLTVSGILAPDPQVGIRLGDPAALDAERWPQLATYFERPALVAALDRELAAGVIWLEAEADSGFGRRDWSPVTFGPERHLGYAVQWFALAATAVVAWLFLAVSS